MFEYHIKKTAEDRQEHKLKLSKLDSEHDQLIRSLRVQLDTQKNEVFEAKKLF